MNGQRKEVRNGVETQTGKLSKTTFPLLWDGYHVVLLPFHVFALLKHSHTHT